jgi:hypothetical protein
VGELRAQPRRAHARQALRGGARRGLRRLRGGPGPPAVRARPAPAAAHDGGWRRAADAPDVQPRVRAAGHAGAVLRGGDRHGREPPDPRPLQRARADAVVGPNATAGSPSSTTRTRSAGRSSTPRDGRRRGSTSRRSAGRRTPC